MSAFSSAFAPLSRVQRRALRALREKRFFKLILGGSFTDVEKAGQLAGVFAAAGADCLDLAPDAGVLQAVIRALDATSPHQPRPMLMISLPLDADPHFRKIELVEPLCILCGACVPVCPTRAIDMTTEALNITQPLCYGCGRCPVVCPTEALAMKPFHPDPQVISTLLANPSVEAVEIHANYADPYMWPDFERRYGEALMGKVLSLCFRPQRLPAEQTAAFLACAQTFAARARPDFPLILQIDGEPMSGTAEKEASLPALQAAQAFRREFSQDEFPLTTISGGVNAHTATYLQTAPYDFLAGAGMGTVARQTVRDALEAGDVAQAQTRARQLMAGFQQGRASAIMREQPPAESV